VPVGHISLAFMSFQPIFGYDGPKLTRTTTIGRNFPNGQRIQHQLGQEQGCFFVHCPKKRPVLEKFDRLWGSVFWPYLDRFVEFSAHFLICFPPNQSIKAYHVFQGFKSSIPIFLSLVVNYPNFHSFSWFFRQKLTN